MLEYCSHQTGIIQVVHLPQGLPFQIPISPSHALYPVPCVTHTPFNSNFTWTPRESTSREAAADWNKQQAAALSIASKHLGGITKKGAGMFGEVTF